MFRKNWIVVCLSALISHICMAQEPVTITGTITQTIQPTLPKRDNRSLAMQATKHTPKRVSLLKLKFTDETKKKLERRIDDLIHHSKAPTLGHYPRAVQLGMNDVPVLDQGEHGTCMLFAMTAALDAALGKGDYISQLCYLDLSQYLSRNTYLPNAWAGSWGQDLANQIAMFGVVPKTVQQSGGCMGRVDYPLFGEPINDELSVFDYHQISEPIQEKNIAFVPLILEEQINSNYINRDHLLYKIKSILNQGERVTCSLLLLGLQRGDIIANGSYHVTNDTWVLLPNMAQELANDEQSAGHAFVITGYDDDAIAIDTKGQLHRGLLTLRNSWGTLVGDQGDFYVTYAYFKAALLEAYQIKKIAV
ncbi:MAG: C1 family peptidase [Gammaproteobacteria bacterium]